MRTILLLSASFLFILPLLAQQKGASSMGETSEMTGTTRAVIVGISEYQDEQIPDLRFAHRDADAMIEYLKSPAGGSIPGNHIMSLTNEKATTTKTAAAMGWSKADTSLQELYDQFFEALEEKKLLEPEGTSAYYLYRALSAIEELEPMYGFMRRNSAGTGGEGGLFHNELGVLHTRLKMDELLCWLGQELEHGQNYPSIKKDSLLDLLRDNPAFHALIKRHFPSFLEN